MDLGENKYSLKSKSWRYAIAFQLLKNGWYYTAFTNHEFHGHTYIKIGSIFDCYILHASWLEIIFFQFNAITNQDVIIDRDVKNPRKSHFVISVTEFLGKEGLSIRVDNTLLTWWKQIWMLIRTRNKLTCKIQNFGRTRQSFTSF